MPPPYRQIPALQSDLSTYARIRNAALEGFATKGVAATSIRDVAAAAGVSAGLVQHHFGTKAGLREAVDRYVVEIAAETFQGLVRDDSADAWTMMGDTVTEWVRDNVVALRYLARALVEGEAEASAIFDALTAIARSQWLTPLLQAEALRPGVDEEWAVLHVVIFNLASVLLESAIDRHLPEPFFSAEQLQRWNAATTDLYRNGLSRPTPSKRKAARS